MKERRKAREIIIKILYRFDVTGDKDVDFDTILQSGYASPFILDNEDTYNIDDTDIYAQNMKIENIKKYLEYVYDDIFKNLENIDKIIADYLVNWPINRICEIDKSILRLSIFEMLFCDDIPAKVSINEAIELSKKYTSQKSKKFINGLLDSVYKKELGKVK